MHDILTHSFIGHRPRSEGGRPRAEHAAPLRAYVMPTFMHSIHTVHVHSAAGCTFTVFGQLGPVFSQLCLCFGFFNALSNYPLRAH